jgi:Domain of unknown function (DUF4709)
MCIFRPGLSDESNTGFFRLDHATQTDIAEITQIKELTNTAQQLLKVVAL